MPSAEASEIVFKKIEKKIKDKIPKYLKEILVLTGFDTITVLKSIDADAIQQIENYVESNKSVFENILNEELVYKSTQDKVFRFMPGHRILLLNFPKYLKESDQCKQKQPASQSTSTHNKKILVIENVSSGNNLPNQTQEIEYLEVYQETDTNSNSIENFGSDSGTVEVSDLKSNQTHLLVKLNKYLNKKKFGFELSDKNIDELVFSNNRIKCKVICPLCKEKEKSIPCFYDSSWKVSNVNLHFKSHLKSTSDPTSDPSKQTNNQSGEQPNTAHTGNTNTDQVNSQLASASSPIQTIHRASILKTEVLNLMNHQS